MKVKLHFLVQADIVNVFPGISYYSRKYVSKITNDVLDGCTLAFTWLWFAFTINFILGYKDENRDKDNYVLGKQLIKHIGHEVEIVKYTDNDNNIVDVCLECLDCNEVVLDAELYTLAARSDV